MTPQEIVETSEFQEALQLFLELNYENNLAKSTIFKTAYITGYIDAISREKPAVEAD